MVVEHEGETAWAAFEREMRAHDRLFADTLPPHEVPPPSQIASSLVRLEPPAAPPALPRVDLVQALALARRGNRVCPKPQAWFGMYAMLEQVALAHGVEPPPPIPLASWTTTSRMAKRMAFRDHVEWAERAGALARLHAMMEALDERSWHHW
jgi:hypothetical protein